jgi:hypothetical protein
MMANLSCANSVLFESISLSNDRQNGFHTAQTQGGHLWELLGQPNVRVGRDKAIKTTRRFTLK